MYWCYAPAEAITLRKNDVPYDELITKPVSKTQWWNISSMRIALGLSAISQEKVQFNLEGLKLH